MVSIIGADAIHRREDQSFRPLQYLDEMPIAVCKSARNVVLNVERLRDRQDVGQGTLVDMAIGGTALVGKTDERRTHDRGVLWVQVTWVA